MDWLEKHKVVLNCFEKTFTCLNEKGETITIKVIPIKFYVIQISALQMKKIVRKGYKVFVVHVMNVEYMNKKDTLKFDDKPILKEFSDLFPKEIPGLPPKR